MDTTSVYVHRDETCIVHLVASFLALRFEVNLHHRLKERQVAAIWPEVMRDLGRVHTVEVELDDRRYRLRTDLAGCAHAVFQAAGVRPPSPHHRPGADPGPPETAAVPQV